MAVNHNLFYYLSQKHKLMKRRKENFRLRSILRLFFCISNKSKVSNSSMTATDKRLLFHPVHEFTNSRCETRKRGQSSHVCSKLVEGKGEVFSTLDARARLVAADRVFWAATAKNRPGPGLQSRGFVRGERKRPPPPRKKRKNRRNKWFRSPSTNYLSRLASGARRPPSSSCPTKRVEKERNKEQKKKRKG